MNFLNRFFFLSTVLFLCINLQAQTNGTIENALIIAANNKSKLENCEQLLVVYNYKPESYGAVLVALEKKDEKWVLKYSPTEAGIGKNGFAKPLTKLEGDSKSPTGIFRLGKLFTYEKQLTTLLEYQQTTKEDKCLMIQIRPIIILM